MSLAWLHLRGKIASVAEQDLANLIERGFKEVGEKIAGLGQRRPANASKHA